MRLKVDENLPVEMADLLRKNGHDAVTVDDQHLGGRPDPALAQRCQREARALVTLDTDFSDIRAYPPADYAGIIVLRLNRQDKTHVLQVMRRLQPLLQKEAVAGRLWIVDEQGVRVRGELS